MPVPVLERRDEAPAVVARGPEPVGEVPAEPAPASRAVPEPERAPAARAAPEPEPVEVVPEAEPAVEVIPEPEPVPVVEPAVVAAATPIVERSRPAKETKPKRRAPSTPVPVPAAVAASEPEAARGETDRPEVVVVPDLRRTEPEPAPEDGSAAAVLDRLVEPVASHPASDEAGDLRARLARTAAVKKPGSKERRELDEQQHRH